MEGFEYLICNTSEDNKGDREQMILKNEFLSEAIARLKDLFIRYFDEENVQQIRQLDEVRVQLTSVVARLHF